MYPNKVRKVRKAYLAGFQGTGGPTYADSLGSHEERIAYWNGDRDRATDLDYCSHRWVWDSYEQMQTDGGSSHCEICGEPQPRTNMDLDEELSEATARPETFGRK